MTRSLALWIAALAVALGAMVAAFHSRFDDSRLLTPQDYMEYWSAGRALLHGQNPYDGATMADWQRGPLAPMVDDPANLDPIMMWNPPWALPFAAVAGACHWRVGQILWLVMNVGSVVASAVLLWKIFGGPKEKAWLAVLLGFAFAPTVFLFLMGQISGLPVLGLVGFLWNVRKQRFALAGICAALTAIKPHLFALFAVVLVLEALLGQKVWRSVLAGGIALAAFSALPLLWNPHVWTQYRAAMAGEGTGPHHTIYDWVNPTLGYWLRWQLPGAPFRAMFAPLLLAVPCTIAYWWVRRATWDWTSESPKLVLASILVAPYGAWGFDLVALLLPVLQATVWLTRDDRPWLHVGLAIAYSAVNAVAISLLGFANSMCQLWLTLCLAALYGTVAIASQWKPFPVHREATA